MDRSLEAIGRMACDVATVKWPASTSGLVQPLTLYLECRRVLVANISGSPLRPATPQVPWAYGSILSRPGGGGFPTVIGGIKYNNWCIQLIKTGKFQIAISKEVVRRSSASIGRGTVGWRILSCTLWCIALHSSAHVPRLHVFSSAGYLSYCAVVTDVL